MSKIARLSVEGEKLFAAVDGKKSELVTAIDIVVNENFTWSIVKCDDLTGLRAKFAVTARLFVDGVLSYATTKIAVGQESGTGLILLASANTIKVDTVDGSVADFMLANGIDSIRRTLPDVDLVSKGEWSIQLRVFSVDGIEVKPVAHNFLLDPAIPYVVVSRLVKFRATKEFKTIYVPPKCRIKMNSAEPAASSKSVPENTETLLETAASELVKCLEANSLVSSETAVSPAETQAGCDLNIEVSQPEEKQNITVTGPME